MGFLKWLFSLFHHSAPAAAATPAPQHVTVQDAKDMMETMTTDLKDHVNNMTRVLRAEIVKATGGASKTPSGATSSAAPPVLTGAISPAPAVPLAVAPAAPAPAQVTDTWPQVIEVDGIHLLASAPINPAFKLDPMTKAYDSPTSYLFDPSNGGKCNPPQPTRSPAGFPLFYAIGANNAPVGEARVLYNGQTFADDAAVAAYITAVATAHAADDVAAAAAAAQVFAGPVPVTTLTHADLQFLWWATINPATPKMHNWEYDVLSGSRAAIQQAMATIGNNVAQMHGYDAAKYNGVLRSHYDAAVKV